MTQNLGDLLKANESHAAEAERRKTLEEQAEKDEDSLRLLLGARYFFDSAFRVFEHRLSNGKPAGVIKLGGQDYRDIAFLMETFRWNLPHGKSLVEGKGVWSEEHPCNHLWDAFQEKCRSHGLEPYWVSAHDGAGVESWFELGVKAA